MLCNGQPENIMIMDDCAKITDYGLLYNINDDNNTLPVGSPAQQVISFSSFTISTAPELCEALIRGTDMFCKGILTTKVDVYSLGCIIIELFSLQTLKFPNLSDSDVLFFILQ